MSQRLFLAALAAAVLLGLYGCAQEPEPTSEPAPSPAVETAQSDEAVETEAATSEQKHQFSNEINVDDLASHISTLASDDFEGRGPGGRGEELTTSYLVEHFEAIGLQPGNGDSWFQAVPMVEINAAPGIEFSISGLSDEPMAMEFGTDVVIGSRQLLTEITLSDSELVYVGYGINAPEYDWNDYQGLDVTGKTVVILVNDPGFATQDPNLFRGNAMTYYGRWTYKYEEAARQGAAGALIIHETAAASYPWAVVQNSWGGAQFDLQPNENTPRMLDVEGWLSYEAAQQLFDAAGLDMQAQWEAAKSRDFEAISLKGLANTRIENRTRMAESNNVIAILPGTQRPDEYILYMAHWDHLGRSFGGPRGPEIYNGAVDNASGIGGLLEIAAAFADATPERSIVFVALALEESGLLGSRYYVQNPLVPLTQTVAAINMDAMQVIGPTRDVVVVGYGNSELEDLLKRFAAEQNRIVVAEPTPENGFYYRSDHFNFAKAGVPALYAKGGIDHREKGEEYGREMAAEYVTNRYHKPADTYDDSWDLRGTVEDLQLLFQVGRQLARQTDWPNWYEGTEFRAARDAMMGEAQ